MMVLTKIHTEKIEVLLYTSKIKKIKLKGACHTHGLQR